MATQWYYAQQGQQRGPVSKRQLQRMAASGELQPDDLIWHEGLADWAPASSIPGLISAERLAAASAASTDSLAHALGQPDAQLLGDPAQANQNHPSASQSSSPDSTDPAAASILDFHPLLALFLTVCTCGLFSLWYLWRLSANHAREAGNRTADSAGRTLGRVRHPAWVLALSYITLGSYFCYWVYAVMRECSQFSGQRPSSARSELTLLFVFPLCVVYTVVFKLPEMIDGARRTAGLKAVSFTQSSSFLNPFLFPALPFLAMLYQDKLNDVWRDAT